ncbi:MAG: methyltransferase domain-containing protein [Polyangiales bacterium]
MTAVPGALAGALYPSAVVLLGRGAGFGTAVVGALSSLGAAAAVLAAAFGLAPAVGVDGVLVGCAALYALAAGVAWLQRPETHDAEVATPTSSVPAPRADLAALALLGAASTAWQTSLTRMGELSFGPSALALAAALAAHVSALGLGELVAARALRRDTTDGRLSVARATRAGAVLATLARPVAAALPSFAVDRLREGTADLGALWAWAFGAVAITSLPVVGCVGAAMAHGARALSTGRSDGEANGAVLLSTSAGNAVGALVTATVVMPRLGVEGALASSAVLLAAASVVMLRPTAKRLAPALALFAAALGGAVWLAKRDPGAALSGPFLYAGGGDVELGEVRWRRDGREATVAVRGDATGAVLLQINGKVDATSEGDAATQTVVGLLPVAMARDPRSVLVVGLGSGMTADAARAVPGVRRVVVTELVPEVIDAARRDFARANHGALSDPRVEVRALDASHYLRGARETFDAIVSEPSNPWVTGMSDLFTREVFEAARERLNPGGAMGAWFHAYSTDGAAVGAIVATFAEVFPRSTLVEVTPGQDYLLVGFKPPVALDLDRALTRLEAQAPAAMLRRAGIVGRAALMSRFIAGADGVRAVGEGAEPLRASDLSLEFRAPTLLYRDAAPEVFARFARVRDLPLAGLGLDDRPGSAWLRLLDESEPAREAGVHARAMVRAVSQDRWDDALREGETAVSLRPDDVSLRGQLARLYLRRASALRRVNNLAGAEADAIAVLELDPGSAERLRALVMLGDLANRRRDGARGFSRYTEAIALTQAAGQHAPELHVRRAESLAILGQRREAAAELDLAIRTTRDPSRRRELQRVRGL